MPSFQTLFEMFWTTTMLLDIVAKTNRYARAVDGVRKLLGGENWKYLTLAEFKVFFSHHTLHGYEETTKCQIILDEISFYFPLFSYK